MITNPNKEYIRDLQNNVINEYSKYMYYMVALAVAAIAYSVHLSLDLKFEYRQIPLGLAVAFWGFSVYCGLGYINSTIVSMKEHARKLEYLGSNIPQTIDQNHLQTLQGFMTASQNKSNKMYRWNERWFYLGLFLFLIWWVWKIYSNSYPVISAG